MPRTNLNLLALWLILFKALILRKWKTWLNAVPCLYKAGLWSASELAVFTFTFPPMFDLVSLDLDSWAQGCLDSTNFRKYCTLFSVILYSGYHCPTAQLGKSLSDLERQQCFSLELDQFDHDKYFRELCSLSNAALVLCTDNEKMSRSFQNVFIVLTIDFVSIYNTGSKICSWCHHHCGLQSLLNSIVLCQRQKLIDFLIFNFDTSLCCTLKTGAL